MNKKNNYITKKGLKKLTDELDQLIKVERPELTKVIAWAAANGDRSENADYIYGKKKLREIDRRLRFLTKRVEAANVVEPTQVTSDKVLFGATVEVMDETLAKKTYSIVGADELDTAKNYISWKSPIGAALLGKEVGDSIVVNTPKGELELEILKIEYIDLDT